MAKRQGFHIDLMPVLLGVLNNDIHVHGDAGREQLTLDFSQGILSRQGEVNTIEFKNFGASAPSGNVLIIDLGGASGDTVRVGAEGVITFEDGKGGMTYVEYDESVENVEYRMNLGTNTLIVPEPVEGVLLGVVGVGVMMGRKKARIEDRGDGYKKTPALR
jgi:hypothetical protein